MKEFNKNFMINTEHTGRVIVKSLSTGKVYYIEAIDDSPYHSIWGDLDPVSKKMQGQYGKKYKGSVTTEESLITPENGFEKIHNLFPGESPISYIERIDKEYQTKLGI
jgi:hypothetical protein